MYAAVAVVGMMAILSLVLYLLYRKHKSENASLENRLSTCSLPSHSWSEKSGGAGLTKTMIQHVTHEERKARFTLFGTPKTGWTFSSHAKTWSTSSNEPLRHEGTYDEKHEAPIYFERDPRHLLSNNPSSPSGSPLNVNIQPERRAHQRDTVIRFVEPVNHQRRSSVPAGTPTENHRFTDRFANLTARIQMYTDTSILRCKSKKRNRRSNSSPTLPKVIHPIDTSLASSENAVVDNPERCVFFRIELLLVRLVEIAVQVDCDQNLLSYQGPHPLQELLPLTSKVQMKKTARR